MNYINRNTGERKTLKQLCVENNVSIPRGMDYGDWTTIKQQPMPVAEEGHFVVQDGVEQKDGVWVYAWKQVPQVEQSEEVPGSVSIFQAVAQLEVEGVLDAVEAYFAAESTPKLEKLAWQKVQQVERHSDLALRMAEMLTWDSDKLDQVFRDAGKIRA